MQGTGAGFGILVLLLAQLKQKLRVIVRKTELLYDRTRTQTLKKGRVQKQSQRAGARWICQRFHQAMWVFRKQYFLRLGLKEFIMNSQEELSTRRKKNIGD